MPRKLWLSAGLLAAGAALLATARFAGATPPSAGIFRVGMTGQSIGTGRVDLEPTIARAPRLPALVAA